MNSFESRVISKSLLVTKYVTPWKPIYDIKIVYTRFVIEMPTLKIANSSTKIIFKKKRLGRVTLQPKSTFWFYTIVVYH